MTNQQGFTLIELMIVVAIIGILASIAVPQFVSFRVNAYNVVAASDVEKGIVVIELFYGEEYLFPNTHAVFSGPGDMVLTNGISITKWPVSDGVSAIYTKGAVSGYCLITKHILGDKIFMSSNLTTAPTELVVKAKESVKLGDAGSIPANLDCSNMQSASIALIGVN